MSDYDNLKGYELLYAVQKQRDSYPLPSKVSELFGEDGKLLGQYQEHRPAQRAILRFAEKSNAPYLAANGSSHNGVLMELSPGVRQALKLPPQFQQLTYKYPWAVKWARVRAGRRVTGYKKFTSLGAAIAFHNKIKPTVPTATIISRVRSYDVPPELRGRLPKPWAWCPRCMTPRKFQRDPDRTFSTMKKIHNPDPTARDVRPFKWVERTVAYMTCPMCGCTNRDSAYRRSNQPWEKRRIKRGVRRVKRRRPR